MSAHHVHHVNVVKHVNSRTFGLSEKKCSQRLFANYHGLNDVLAAINHIARLQTIGVQPAHV
jgi:hypothetical protein